MSVFHPDGGFPRLLRYVPASEMPTPDTLTTYDDKFNIVVINQELFNTLDWYGKHRAQRATTTLLLDTY